MLRVKHFMDRVETDDGHRLWIETIGLTRDLQQMCDVHHVLSHLGPPSKLWLWYEQHPEGFEHFRSKYLQHLASGAYREALVELGAAAQRENFTLLHQYDDPLRNAATVLAEFISQVQPHPKET